MRSEPLILGIGATPGGGACLVRGRHALVAIEESRLTGIEHAPVHATGSSLSVAYCLAAAGVAPSDLDLVACAAEVDDAGTGDVTLNPQLQVARHNLAWRQVSIEEAGAAGTAADPSWTRGSRLTLGAAAAGLHQLRSALGTAGVDGPFEGRSYGDDEVRAAIGATAGVRMVKSPDPLAEFVDRLRRGQTGAWWSGRSAFGHEPGSRRGLLRAPADGPAGSHTVGELPVHRTPLRFDDEPVAETPADALWLLICGAADVCLFDDRHLVERHGIDSLLDLVPRRRAASYTFAYPVSGARLELRPARARVTAEATSPWGAWAVGVNPLEMAVVEAVDGSRTGRDLLDWLNQHGAMRVQDSWLARTLYRLRRRGLLAFDSRTGGA